MSSLCKRCQNMTKGKLVGHWFRLHVQRLGSAELVHSGQTIEIHFISAVLQIEALLHLVDDLFLVSRVVGSAVLPARLYSGLKNQTRTLVPRRECDAQLDC